LGLSSAPAVLETTGCGGGRVGDGIGALALLEIGAGSRMVDRRRGGSLASPLAAEAAGCGGGFESARGAGA
jgi:hypothetical protein